MNDDYSGRYSDLQALVGSIADALAAASSGSNADDGEAFTVDRIKVERVADQLDEALLLARGLIAEAASKGAAEGHGDAERILVMDDDEVMRNLMRSMLESLGYMVICTSDGAEAVSVFQQETAANRPLRASFLDLRVPGGMGGQEAVARMRSAGTEAPIFVISGYATDPVMAEPEAYGFTGSICKPFRRVELEGLLSSVTAHDSPVVMHVAAGEP